MISYSSIGPRNQRAYYQVFKLYDDILPARWQNENNILNDWQNAPGVNGSVSVLG